MNDVADLRSLTRFLFRRSDGIPKVENGDIKRGHNTNYREDPGSDHHFWILLVADLPKAVLLKSGLLKQLVEALQVARLSAREKNQGSWYRLLSWCL
ncbi:MAG: hypothetical protein V3T03_03590, partial [Candidatus Bipolaricaulota bacterium]